ncbi:hypothetical protein KKC94_04255 [Patescibacteria group bacterium]|nr:hypothetical protein [Patescibacteria group bacterium]
MSLTQRVKQGFLRLPQLEKALLIGGFILMLSPLLPWYDNRGAAGIGQTYLGVQGPMFVVGILVAALGAFFFLKMFLPLTGRNFFMKRKNGGVALAVGFQSLLLILVANSIFFHPEFGINVSHKATRFGMIFAFAGVATLLVAGYFCYKKQKDMTPEEVIEEMKARPLPPVDPVISSYQDEPETSFMPSYSVPVRTESSTYEEPEVGGIPPRPDSPYSRPEGAYQGDPLQLDAKTRYKMMQSKARANLWQGRSDDGNSASGLSSLRAAEDRTNRSIITENMKIRTDL